MMVAKVRHPLGEARGALRVDCHVAGPGPVAGLAGPGGAVEFQNLEQWEASERGLSPVEATMMVAIPELDGAIAAAAAASL
jgi:hypothetical protein